jgi:hypothetical protein
MLDFKGSESTSSLGSIFWLHFRAHPGPKQLLPSFSRGQTAPNPPTFRHHIACRPHCPRKSPGRKVSQVTSAFGIEFERFTWVPKRPCMHSCGREGLAGQRVTEQLYANEWPKNSLAQGSHCWARTRRRHHATVSRHVSESLPPPSVLDSS